ncbi:MAG: VCBS repeat-containing protein [Akkermansiaceae bacterium]|nr:VCBS repeat-containing protein [Akkermansiaceae bacterium]
MKQKAIWDAEHITFKIEQRFGKRFLASWKARDTKSLAALFHPKAEGSVIAAEAKMEKRNKGVVSEERRKAVGQSTSASADQLAASIIAELGSIKTITSAKLRVLKIEAAPAQGELEQWKTNLLLSATGTDAKGGLLAIDSKHDALFRIPAGTDFSEGAALQSWDIVSDRRRHSERMLMEEITVNSGLERNPIIDNWTMPQNMSPQQFRQQIAVEDFNGDGYPDVALATLRGATGLYLSVKGTQFILVNKSLGLPLVATRPMRALATWIDINNDGWPDLILGDRIYLNHAGKRFEEITATCGLTFPQTPMSCAVADFDCDGYPDLYVLYQFAGDGVAGSLPWVGDDSSGSNNVLWRNRGDGTFEDVTTKANAGGGKKNSFAATWLFADDDHFPDLYVANDFGTNNLLRNRGDGTFEEIAKKIGVADFATSMGVASGDLDNDGSPEIYVANMYSKMGRRIIGQVDESDYSPGVYDQIKSKGLARVTVSIVGVSETPGSFPSTPKNGGLTISVGLTRLRWPTSTTTASSISTRPRASSASSGGNPTDEPACGGLSCHSLTIETPRSKHWAKSMPKRANFGSRTRS